MNEAKDILTPEQVDEIEKSPGAIFNWRQLIESHRAMAVLLASIEAKRLENYQKWRYMEDEWIIPLQELLNWKASDHQGENVVAEVKRILAARDRDLEHWKQESGKLHSAVAARDRTIAGLEGDIATRQGLATVDLEEIKQLNKRVRELEAAAKAKFSTARAVAEAWRKQIQPQVSAVLAGRLDELDQQVRELEAEERSALSPPPPPEIPATPCGHDRLTEDGICRQCGADCRGIGGSIPAMPLRSADFAEEVQGSDVGWLVTLECGHKLATRKKHVQYECRQCSATARKGEGEQK